MAKNQRRKLEQIATLLRQIDVLTTNGKTLTQAFLKVAKSIPYSLRKIEVVDCSGTFIGIP